MLLACDAYERICWRRRARLTLAAYLRVELDKLAARRTNAELVERLARRDRRGGPSVADTVAEIRRLRETS